MSTGSRFKFDVDEIKDSMRQCIKLATAWNGSVYRTSKTKHATVRELLNGEGSRRNGGRWNRGDIAWDSSIDLYYQYKSFTCVYTYLSPEAALSETHAHVKYYNLPEDSVYPRTWVCVRVNLNKVLDLARDDRALNVLKVSRDVIRGIDWRKIQDVHREAITQRIGREARELGFEGILTPSAASIDGMNLVFFPDRRLSKSSWEIIDPENQLQP
jgi:RES domain-containing protein